MATSQSKTPAGIFQENYGEICPLIGKRKNFSNVTNNLFAKKLITKEELNQIETQPNLNDEERGRKVAVLLLDKIDEDEGQAAQCLLDICDVFESKRVNNEPLRKIGASMKEKLSTKANQTSGRQGKKIDKDNGHDETDSGSQGPPIWKYNDAIVNYHPKKVEFTEDLVKDIEILLLPATDTEEKEVMYYLKQSEEKPVKTKIDRIKIHVGYYGKSKVIVIKTAPATSMQGSVYAAIITTKILERVKSIKYVIAVGVCFGKGSPEKQKLGDVVISTMICDCLSIRQGVDKESRRAGDYSVKQDILSEFECPHNFEMPLNIKVLKVPIVTTPNLINNSKIKDELFKKSPIAKAGEMEGAGIMAAIEYAPERAEVIVIKGIGDWGDETKEDTKEWKPFAARAAAHYVHAILSLDK